MPSRSSTQFLSKPAWSSSQLSLLISGYIRNHHSGIADTFPKDLKQLSLKFYNENINMILTGARLKHAIIIDETRTIYW